MVWYNASLTGNGRDLRHNYQCDKCGFTTQLDNRGGSNAIDQEVRRLLSADRATLQRIARELSYTNQVIERGKLAYLTSLRTLGIIERSQAKSQKREAEEDWGR